ncbi:FAD-linked oxidase C-terminal domain-containing protein [Flammeovirgaceae bacterium SG7u.111]|nr:FAD-linked oxidase C-terminal domain-containing protein [Flammeovirgaceae bacterium SG7u.132]WPO36317.1 FAD-linked oxidase C-terminal domain-containing protein [Flammeovirgaceae bacterium SG7u.111]
MKRDIVLTKLEKQFEGELHYSDTMKVLYATDASAYRELPLAVAFPKHTADIKTLIDFANTENISLIPRTAGTSLAGQVVGSGIVVDVSRTFTKILEVNKEESWVRLQPGVVRDELNRAIASQGLFFGPETSTANRAMVGGMVGNNSCGSNSVVYGSTREHLLEVEAILSDGSEVTFKALTNEEFEKKCAGKNIVSPLEQAIYKELQEILSDTSNQQEIRDGFPKPSIPRRNTGYAIDLLLETAPFTAGKEPFNFCKLIAGSEGTLAFITEIKIHVDKTPPAYKTLVCAHFETVDESLHANLVALKHNPSACELMDHYVLECTKTNIEHRQNRFFVNGDPGAILVVEISRDTPKAMDESVNALIADLKKEGYGYDYPLVTGADVKKVWGLRKAGLGLLSNLPGDAKPAPVIEDTAVDVEDLPAFIADFNKILKKNDLYCVHYAHAGSGELHLRPIIDLKTQEGHRLFRLIAEEIAKLVKKYRGSLSGEHGDGRLRGEFIQYMVGDKNYKLIERVKEVWDPKGIFNPGKIVGTPPMDTSLRYDAGQKTPNFKTYFDFSNTQGYLRAAEMCNGSGDCRKSELTGGTMCPSYMATRNEKDTTRARANVLREFLTRPTESNPFAHEEVKEVLDLCLSCKGCKSECPSNVDMARLKAEFYQHHYEQKGVPFRSKMIANVVKANNLASIAPGIYNFLIKNSLTGSLIKQVNGFAQERPIPQLHSTTLKKWAKKNIKPLKGANGKVLLFCDEFTNFNDTPIGIKAVQLLEKLNYAVEIPNHIESGRASLSKGLVKNAKEIATKNVKLLAGKVTPESPLVGIEPSAILTFRDEYPDLVPAELKEAAKEIAANTYLIDEFIANEADKKKIDASYFTTEKQLVKVHGHCHQKALSSLTFTKKMLTLPANYEVHMIPSGCCGMAGSFGYEKEHYEVSMKVGELVLFPTVRKQPDNVIIAAPGTSCRHQIKDGTGRKAIHTLEVLWNALV